MPADNAEQDVADAGFGLEHIMRELGQVYESIFACIDKAPSEKKIGWKSCQELWPNSCLQGTLLK